MQGVQRRDASGRSKSYWSCVPLMAGRSAHEAAITIRKRERPSLRLVVRTHEAASSLHNCSRPSIKGNQAMRKSSALCVSAIALALAMVPLKASAQGVGVYIGPGYPGYAYPAYPGYYGGYPAYGYAYPSYGYAYPSYGYGYRLWASICRDLLGPWPTCCQAS